MVLKVSFSKQNVFPPKKNKPWKAWILVGFKPDILAKLRQIKGVKILQANP
jgi:hypothetical protein